MNPDSWDLFETFAFAVAYGLYLTLSIVVLAIVILETNFFTYNFNFPASMALITTTFNDNTLLILSHSGLLGHFQHLHLPLVHLFTATPV
jgi:H+-transporting ATPase